MRLFWSTLLCLPPPFAFSWCVLAGVIVNMSVHFHPVVAESYGVTSVSFVVGDFSDRLPHFCRHAAVVEPQKLAYERQARSLFTIRESLKDQNAELVDDVNKRQYKFIIEGHRKELLASDGATVDEQDISNDTES